MEIGFLDWPTPSDDDFILVAAQLWLGMGLVSEKALFYVLRIDNIEEILEQVRGFLRVGVFFGPDVDCEIHFELEGQRFGPVLTTDQWQACLALPRNGTRINLLLLAVA
nr:hypothetical protein [Tanacetum cinerariifolium]